MSYGKGDLGIALPYTGLNSSTRPRNEVVEPDLRKIEDGTEVRAKRWIRAAVTLFLLLIVVIAGIAVHSSRQQWWEAYKEWIFSGG